MRRGMHRNVAEAATAIAIGPGQCSANAAPVENTSEAFVNTPRRLARKALDATIPLSCRFYSIGSI
jgi:hypothetical protein